MKNQFDFVSRPAATQRYVVMSQGKLSSYLLWVVCTTLSSEISLHLVVRGNREVCGFSFPAATGIYREDLVKSCS